jgi:hypothetical protein
MLAKIAHSFVIAERGLAIAETYAPLLPDLILGRKNYLGYVIGGEPALHQRPEPDAIHQLAILNDPEERFLGIRIRLFAYLGSPVYYVAFGINRSAAATLRSSNDDSTALM